MLRISGYGQTGPYRDLPGFGAIGEAMGGLRHLTGEPGRVPVRCGISIGDTLAALHGTIGILIALYHRKVNGGQGQVIDVALNEAVFNVMESLMPEYSAFGAVREAAGSALPGIAPSNAYRCADGYVLIAGNGDSIFKRLMQTIGRDDLGADPELADNAGRVARVAELDAAIEAWTLTQPVERGARACSATARVPAGKVYTAKDIAEDPHYRARDMILRQTTRDGHELDVPGVVPKLLGTPGTVRSSAPRLGDDTDAVLRELGFPTRTSPRCAARRWWHEQHLERRRQAHPHAGSRHARRPAGRSGLRADRGQDRAGQRAVAGRHGEDRGHVLRVAQGDSRAARRRDRAARDRAQARRGLQRAGAQRARRRTRHRCARRRVQPRDVGQRDPQPGQPAHDARAVVRGACRTSTRSRGRPSVAVNVSLSCSFGCPMEGDVPRGHRARLVRTLRRRDGRARRHAVRHHRHGLSEPGGAS